MKPVPSNTLDTLYEGQMAGLKRTERLATVDSVSFYIWLTAYVSYVSCHMEEKKVRLCEVVVEGSVQVLIFLSGSR
jgi:hypothetical protein